MDRLWRYAGDATFSWEGQDGAVQTPPSPGSESGDDPALDSDSQGEGSSDRGDRSDNGDSDGEAERQVFETNRPTRGGRPPQWLREYVEI